MSTRDPIQESIERFVSDMEAMIRTAAVASVTAALGPAVTPRATRTADAPAAKATKTAKATAKARTRGGVGRRAVGRRRTASEVAKTRDDILAWLRKNPASTMEKLAGGLSVRSAELARPIKELLSGKRISKTGQKRATKYSAG